MLARLISAAALPLLLLGACMDRPVAALEPATTNIFVDRIPTARVERIDLLFMVDNSLSMADKQALLAQAVPQLVERMVDPPCVSRDNAPPQPSNGGQCPEGFKREFAPLADIHIGVITSALGSHGADGCASAQNPDDHTYLVPFARPADGLPSYAGTTGFLAWDPHGRRSPKGTADPETLKQELASHVRAARENGCGYEASLEAWYRFLIDPEPPAALKIENDKTVPTGIDQLVLDQRRAFLRPDSLVAVIMLTDENDCSVMDEGPGWLPMRVGSQSDMRMFRGSSDCARDPNSPCCRLCGSGEAAPPQGCVPLKDDLECKKSVLLTPPEDDINLRCYDHKRRFGFDFLYPIDRYVKGLKNTQVNDRSGKLVDNPLYTDLVNGGPATRTPELVFLAGIVGVPWQDVATPETLADPRRLEYLRAAEIPWDRVLGDPMTGAPKDSLMIETTVPRLGAPPHPVTGAAIASPDAPSASANPINGHEHAVARELQYACTFPLDTDFETPGIQPRPCTGDKTTSCDCDDAEGGKRSLCQDPTTGAYSTTQWSAKAYPGVRHLQVLKGLGKNAIVASICPKVLDGDPRDTSFGYNPAVDSIVDVLADSLKFACLPRPLDVAEDGSVPCQVIENTRPKPGEACDCSSAGRRDPDPVIVPAVWARMTELRLCGAGTNVSCESQCVCEITPAGTESDGDCSSVDTPLEACQCDEAPNVVGYCYINPAKKIGSPELVEDCKDNEARALRLVGTAENPTPRNGSTVFVACVGSAVSK